MKAKPYYVVLTGPLGDVFDQELEAPSEKGAELLTRANAACAKGCYWAKVAKVTVTAK